MKKINLILVALLAIFFGCTTEIDNTGGNDSNETKKYSYTVSIDNASEFAGCTFEYRFYLDGNSADTKKTPDSSVTFTTEKLGEVKVDVIALDNAGNVKGERLGKICLANTNTDFILSKKSGADEDASLESIEVLADDSNLYVKEKCSLTVKAKFSDGTEKDVTSSASFRAADTTILSVSSSGEVQGLKKGTCTVTLSYTENGTTKETFINFEIFNENEEKPEKVLQSITLSTGSVNLTVGDTFKLGVTASYSGSSDADITAKAKYLSSNSSVAAVSGGVITAMGSGSAEITVSYTENGVTKSATCSVAVKVLSSIAFDESVKTIHLGSEAEIILNAIYSDESSVKVPVKDAVFKSDNDSIVSISPDNSVFEAKGVGTAKITAQYKGKTAEITISVTNDVILNSVALDITGTKTTYTLKATALYSDGTTKDVTSSATFTVDDENIASVSGSTLTAKANGKVVVTVVYEGKRSSKELEVLVDTVPVLSSIAVNLSVSSIEVGETTEVKVTATYSDGTTKDVTTEATLSCDGTAATLSGQIINGVSAGKAVIKAEFNGETASTSVTVKEAINGYRVHFYGANWSTYKIYYYNTETQRVSAWESMPSMSAESEGYYYDLTESWVAAGTTMVIFYGGSNDNRYPADGQDGVVIPAGVKEAWFNFETKTFEISNPFSTEPVVSVSPAGNASFSGASQSVTVTAKNCASAKYTTDGSDPKTSATAVSFVSSKSFTVGEGISVGSAVTVKVWGTDGTIEVSAGAVFTKIEKPSTPNRLGAYYTGSATSFSIWSPDSVNVTVTVKPVGGTEQTYTCTKGFKVDGDYPDSANIYGVTVPGDLHLAEYQFKIDGVAVRDPYGKMIKYDGNQQKSNKIADGTENGFTYTSYAGPSVNIVVDMDKTEPSGGWAARPTLENRCDAIVYEVHVGDFSSDSSWGGSSTNAGKFPGMVESGTSYSGVTTGLDHLKELGVTHVQLLPMYDFATKYNTSLNDIYNWGYDPVNYNVPEDRYSTCPDDYVERIREVKEMINEFHKNGIRVIMDVVYNHTFAKEMFSSISSKYYTSTDLSGCGNSTNTGAPMVSRMIRDSLEYWADEYNLDGFRFDLIGIYHTSAVKDWGEYLNNTKFPDRNLLMYGEPWNGYATDSEESAKVRMSAVASLGNAHVGVFNGKFRQSLKGANDTAKMGYIFNANEDDGTAYAANIAVGLKGSGTSLDKTGCSDTSGTWTRFFTVSPDQSINYMFAHDNLCYWDKIKAAEKSGEYAQRIVKFGHGILLVSQGIPFIHAGDEFLRTKEKGAGSSMSHNSYMAGTATNSIDWKLKKENKAISDYHADLIKLRKEHDGLRYRNGVGTTETSGNAVKYYVQDSDGTKLCIVVNPGNNISKPVSGTTIFDINGATPASTQCEGTAVTVIKY